MERKICLTLPVALPSLMYVVTIQSLEIAFCLAATWASWSQWMNGTKHYTENASISDNAAFAKDHAANAMNQAAQASIQSVHDTAKRAAEGVKGATESIYEGGKHVFEKAKETGDNFKESIGNAGETTAHQTSRIMSEAKDVLVERGKDAAHWAGDHLAHLGDDAADLLTRLRQRIMGIRQHGHNRSDHSQGMRINNGVTVKVLPDYYLIFLDVPGMPKESLHLHCARNQLLVYGSHEECLGGVGRACLERSVDEVFDLPEDANQMAIVSWIDLQVLIIKIPRRPLNQERSIPVSQRGSIDKVLEKVGLESPIV